MYPPLDSGMAVPMPMPVPGRVSPYGGMGDPMPPYPSSYGGAMPSPINPGYAPGSAPPAGAYYPNAGVPAGYPMQPGYPGPGGAYPAPGGGVHYVVSLSYHFICSRGHYRVSMVMTLMIGPS